MINRGAGTPEAPSDDVWRRIAAPVPGAAINWRQDGRPVTRDGRTIARFVAFIEANTVRDRLDSVVPGNWDLTLELLPPLAVLDGGEDNPAPCAFKARLQVLGVIREDVGVGKDYKQAATDAFKRAAVRFGIAHELYDYDQNWVELDGDGKWAKPVEDPGEAYERKMERKGSGAKPVASVASPAGGSTNGATTAVGGTSAPAPAGTADPSCPKCGGRMWDNRASKKNPRAPDFKCRDRSCDGVIWPQPMNVAPKGGKQPVSYDGVGFEDMEKDDLPFD